MTENNIEHQPWMDSPNVSTVVDYEEDSVDEIIDVSKIAWFDVRMDIPETEIEKKERMEAMAEQIRLGILQPNGYPVGMEVPAGMRVVGIPPKFNFPGAIGIPLPNKFNPTPITTHLQKIVNQPHNGNMQSPIIPIKGQDRTIFERGNEKLRRIQEMTRDRRK